MAAIPSLAGNELVIHPVPDDLVEELQRVQKIAQTITSILDLDQVIDSIVNDVRLSTLLRSALAALTQSARGGRRASCA